jgi:hypothetical protein
LLKHLLGDFSRNAVVEDAPDQTSDYGGHRAVVDVSLIAIELAKQFHLDPAGGNLGIAAFCCNRLEAPASARLSDRTLASYAEPILWGRLTFVRRQSGQGAANGFDVGVIYDYWQVWLGK